MTSEAPERIWVDDERGIGGVASIHEEEPVYIDQYVTEYVRADALAAAQEENERLREALEWHPIETAPRDGAVLLYFGNRQWRDMHDNTVRLPEPRNTIERIEAGWCEDGDIRESGTGHSVWEEWREPENFPTYWMPMLTPPRAALGKEGT